MRKRKRSDGSVLDSKEGILDNTNRMKPYSGKSLYIYRLEL